jgi:uncharacterized membrane protein affecting hemolysin expression
MTFEKKIAKLQEGTLSDRRTTALVVTVVLFVPLMAFLIYIGAFSISSDHERAENNQENVMTETESVAETLEKVSAQFIASTTASLEKLEQMASTTLQDFAQDQEAATTSSSTTQTITASTTETSTAGDEGVIDE